MVALLAFSIIALTWCDTSFALTLSFSNISNNDPNDAEVGEAQLFVEVLDSGGQASFRFYNTGPEDSTISEIYFDDGSLLGISSVLDGSGVDFEEDANPPNLPDHNNISPAFQVTAGFLAEAQPSPAINGVDPGEEVTIIFDLQGAQTIDDVFDELATGALRIGIHVISFPSGGSSSFVNNAVPEPSTMALLGLGTVALLARRRNRQY